LEPLIRVRTPLPSPVDCRGAAQPLRRARRQQADVYYENEPGRRSAAKLLTKDEARRIAANIARCEWTKQKQSPKHVARGFFIVLALGTTA